MNATAIDYVWQVIRESERSDELRFWNDEKPIAVAAQPQPDQPNAVSHDPIIEIANNSKMTTGDSLQIAMAPPLPQP